MDQEMAKPWSSASLMVTATLDAHPTLSVVWIVFRFFILSYQNSIF